MALFGRSALSWFKITLFYCVYYTLLGFLFTFFLNSYWGGLPEPGSRPRINTRTDQPGAGVWPFTSIIGTEADGDDNKLTLSMDLSKEQDSFYVDSLNNFTKTYDNSDASVCVNDDVYVKTCKVPNADLVTPAKVNEWVQNRTPVVIIALNKIIGWNPLNRALAFPDIGANFEVNSVYVRCHESLVSGDTVKDSTFKFEYVGDKGISSNYFPYMAKDLGSIPESLKVRYQKPFIAIKILPTKSKVESSFIDSWETKMHFFRCEIDADNISKPATDEYLAADPKAKAYSADLTKLGIGFVTFGLSYSDDAAAVNQFYVDAENAST